jgi:hypothetical protein
MNTPPATGTARPTTTSSAHPGPTDSAAAPGLDLEKVIGGSGSPYFSDPYPVYRSSHGESAADPHIVFGTPDAVLLCPGPLSPGCYRRHSLDIEISPALTAAANAAGTVITATQNHNPFQGVGGWSMALTVSVRRKSAPAGDDWSVILHARPASAADPVPTTWIADSVLEGSLAHQEYADYDGKYYETGGTLYLLYSKRLSDTPARDGVVAQQMRSLEDLAATGPVLLLQPTPGAGYTSENFFVGKPDSQFKLVETGNVSRIDGTYVMAYSTGDFEENDYKTGIAWSDTFLPPKGAIYRKLVGADTADVWGNASRQDVDYLMQSQESQSPHYAGNQVLAPGVPSIVQEGDAWYLIFAGYQPSGGAVPAQFDAADRQPYFAPLCLSGTPALPFTCAR